MKMCNYRVQGATRVGVIKDGLVYDVKDVCKKFGFENVNTVDELLKKGLLQKLCGIEEQIYKEESVPLSSVKIVSPVLNPEKIFLAAVNYYSHASEGKTKPFTSPYFFTRFRNCIVNPDEPILIPRISKKVDWEVELALIVSKRAKYVERSECFEYVAGYTVANDISFRDLQFPATPYGPNWVKGKALDSSLPLGPWLVTPDEIPDPYSLELKLRVNGETMQNGRASDMIFSIEELVENLSAGITLEPADVICTGTPEGVAFFTGKPFLKSGDVVEAEISKIGVLRNPVVEEKL
ncbi:hypothetical protein B9Q01_07195 [Candidatus Marsarchaeota G1 archaeon OSP_D]|jgi:2-keto-4-pentenoate hydratase/2-oxohepta-3-ene-1,7-dioic acid hydratase (catechol pathway)|uniref:Fumarylacetoacetase-like C-terminal domain-containing protein n=1 Tax=Candidatus Marsarchaeota G1 archaeon OSP_D TaxID=1978155 RepID=A0A2R6A8W8_9ARCH|nr:MAG: hypothetical protein B9Q01_07195 [Candidatus Marsarchaeota G1 archaeon OSP_D]